MPELSLFAQAVRDAAFDPWQSTDTPESIAAAALRAAVDQVEPDDGVSTEVRQVLNKIHTIAAELEAQ